MLKHDTSCGQTIRVREAATGLTKQGTVVWVHPQRRFALVEFKTLRRMQWASQAGGFVWHTVTTRECFQMMPPKERLCVAVPNAESIGSGWHRDPKKEKITKKKPEPKKVRQSKKALGRLVAYDKDAINRAFARSEKTKTGLCSEMKVSWQTLSDLQNGAYRHVRSGTLEKIAAYLGVPVTDFIPT